MVTFNFDTENCIMRERVHILIHERKSENIFWKPQKKLEFVSEINNWKHKRKPF